MKETREKRNLKEQRAITLIALVITIIVLLILAAVSIATLTGENGILTQADKSKTANEKGEPDDIIRLVLNEWQIEKNKTDGQNLEDFLNSKVPNELDEVNANGDGSYTVKVKGYQATINANGELVGEITKVGETPTPPDGDTVTPGVIVTGENKEYTKNGTAKIPVGFAIVPGLDDVSQGLVISDVANDTTNTGNQFVWIPVASGTKYVRNTTYADTDISENAIDDTDYLPTGVTIPEGKTEVEIEEEMVRNAGGFYIARYEAGKEVVEETDTLVSKKGATVWVDIAQTDAKATAKTFINNSNVKSALITGIQWDMVMAFISSETRTDGTGATYDVTAASDTRHKGSSVEVAGNNEADKVCNIYDLEGNTWEYIAEKNTCSDDFPRMLRGGNYFNSVSASNRDAYSGKAVNFYSFRPVLYVM